MDERSDVRVESRPGIDEHHGTIRVRRLVRWVAVLVVGIVAVLAVWQDSLS